MKISWAIQTVAVFCLVAAHPAWAEAPNDVTVSQQGANRQDLNVLRNIAGVREEPLPYVARSILVTRADPEESKTTTDGSKNPNHDKTPRPRRRPKTPKSKKPKKDTKDVKKDHKTEPKKGDKKKDTKKPKDDKKKPKKDTKKKPKKDPKKKDPKKKNPKKKDPKKEDPKKEDPKKEDPKKEEPKEENPSPTDPSTVPTPRPNLGRPGPETIPPTSPTTAAPGASVSPVAPVVPSDNKPVGGNLPGSNLPGASAGPSPSGQEVSDKMSGDSSSKLPTIVGAVVGTVALVGLVALGVYRQRERRQTTEEPEAVVDDEAPRTAFRHESFMVLVKDAAQNFYAPGTPGAAGASAAAAGAGTGAALDRHGSTRSHNSQRSNVSHHSASPPPLAHLGRQ